MFCFLWSFVLNLPLNFLKAIQIQQQKAAWYHFNSTISTHASPRQRDGENKLMKRVINELMVGQSEHGRAIRTQWFHTVRIDIQFRSNTSLSLNFSLLNAKWLRSQKHRFLAVISTSDVTTSVRSKAKKGREIGQGCLCWTCWPISSCQRSSPWDSSFTFRSGMAEKTRKWNSTISQYLFGNNYGFFCEFWKDHSSDKGLFAFTSNQWSASVRNLLLTRISSENWTQEQRKQSWNVNDSHSWQFQTLSGISHGISLYLPWASKHKIPLNRNFASHEY